MKIRLLLKVVFLFFGTFLHELAHYIAALIFGRPSGFSVVPRISGEHIVFGNVKAATRFKVLSSFIAIAPVIWWVVLCLFLAHLRMMRINAHLPGLDIALSPGRMRTLSWTNLLLLWLAIQFLWAGIPSVQDIRTFFSGLISLSGALLCGAAAVVIYLIVHTRPGLLLLQ